MPVSIEAMPEGGEIVLRAHLKKLEETRERVGFRRTDFFSPGETVALVRIEDSGPGIPDDVLEKLWDPFFTTKRASGGSGLGLSVVRSLVEMHRGNIEIGNKEGGGTRVTIMLKV